MGGYFFILDAQGAPRPVADALTWGRWFEDADRSVAWTTVGDVNVSTIFLGLNHRFWPDEGPPILWETMIFGGPLDGFQDRYESKAGALQGHAEAVARVRARLPSACEKRA